MTEEATIFVVFFPTSWPPPEVTDVSQGETPLGRLIFRLAPSGSIAVIVHGDHAERTLFEGQPIAFSGPPGMLIDVVFADGNAEVRVNGQQLRPLAETSDVLLIETRGLAPEELPSFLRADATEICAGAIQRRRDWLAGPARIPEKWKEGARPLSDDEQRTQLAEAVLSLKDLVQAVRSGHRHFAGPLASLLRALLHREAGRPTYNPTTSKTRRSGRGSSSGVCLRG